MKEVKWVKVLITGGGTGGHVFPGLMVAQALKSHEVLYAGSPYGLERRIIGQTSIPFYPIHARALLGKGIFGKIIGLAYLGLGFFQSLLLLLRLKPRVVLGTGGYVSGPVLLASTWLRIPSLLLEQNVLPGRTTRFLSRFVSKVLVSFEESRKYLAGARVEVTGNPVRSEIGELSREEGCRRLDLSSDRPVVGVMGASQGARAINRVVVEALPRLVGRHFQMIHLTGEAHHAEVLRESQSYRDRGGFHYKVIPFLEDMPALYAASDLLISRAGATTLAEITRAGKPSVLIPYPHAADHHQEANAGWLEEKGGCRVIPQKDFSVDTFCGVLDEWLDRPEAFAEMGKKARQVARTNALHEILRAIGEVAGEKI